MKKILSVFLLILLCTAAPWYMSAGAVETEQNKDLITDRQGDGSPIEKGLLRVSLTDPVSTMDVQKTTADYLIPLNIYERLFDIAVNEDGSTKLAYGLAEDYSVSEDGRTYRFTLREDAFFSDGTPVKASDVAFTFTRMLSMEESVQKDFADMIQGAESVIAGKKDTLDGIRVLDDTHLLITLSEPFAGYIYQLATPSCSILSEAFVTGAGSLFGSDAEQTIGSGPYMVTEFSKERIVLERNPYYHCHEGEELSATKAEILILQPALIDQAFRSGDLDLLDANQVNPDVVESVYKSDTWKDRLISPGRVEIQFLMMNVEEPPLDDVRIRKAVQMAINRQEILNRLFGGDGVLVDGIYPKGLIEKKKKNQGWLQYNPEEAKKLIDQVEGAKEICLELGANSQSPVRKLAMLEMIRHDLSSVGLNVSIVSYDSESLLYLRRKGRLMAYSGEWSADFNDPDNFIYTFFGSTEKTKNRSGNYSDVSVFKRIARARTMLNEEERLSEYSDLEMLLVRDEAVWVPLFSTEHLFVLGDRVESFTPFWAGWSSMYFKDVVLKKGQ